MTLVRDKTPKMQRSGSQEADWFEEWFGEDYLRIYQHRDEEEAEHAIELIVSNLPGREIRSVLDLGCGAGRHTKVLFERWWTVGLDLSMALLKVARKESPDAPDDREHARVLACVRAALRPGGTLVIDYLNASQVRKDLVPYDERVASGITIEQSRAITPDDRFVEKTIRLRERGREYIERVRLLTASDLEWMLKAAGFEVLKRFGDYGGSGWSEDSPRVILFANRQ